jgi:hypothetical protein
MAGIRPRLKIRMWQQQDTMRQCLTSSAVIARSFGDNSNFAALQPRALTANFQLKPFHAEKIAPERRQRKEA